MMLANVKPDVIRGIWDSCEPRIGASPYIEEVAQTLVDAVYEQFEDALVMVRAFITVPYECLPERQRQFAADLARSVGREHELRPHTPVHCLVATRGCDPDWNDRRKSQGHVAIPLLSEEFVESIPMMSRLLKDLGLPLTWVQSAGSEMLKQTFGSVVGVFLVSNAADATDELGRKIIHAQDFVHESATNSVLAVGGVVFGGAAFCLILFSGESVELRTARTFMPLVNYMKGVMVTRCSESRVFAPETNAPAEGTASPAAPAGDSR